MWFLYESNSEGSYTHIKSRLSSNAENLWYIRAYTYNLMLNDHISFEHCCPSSPVFSWLRSLRSPLLLYQFKDGDRFWKVSECYIRGNNIKYLRLPDEVIDMAMQSEKRPRGGRKTRGRGGARGKVSSRGRGRGEWDSLSLLLWHAYHSCFIYFLSF